MKRPMLRIPLLAVVNPLNNRLRYISVRFFLSVWVSKYNVVQVNMCPSLCWLCSPSRSLRRPAQQSTENYPAQTRNNSSPLRSCRYDIADDNWTIIFHLAAGNMIEVRLTIYIVFLYNITNREVENDVGTSQVSDLPGIFGKNERKKRREHVNDQT